MGKGVERVDYLTYLQVYDRLFEAVPKAKKSSADYRSYVTELLQYLYEFTQRIRPLMDITRRVGLTRPRSSQVGPNGPGPQVWGYPGGQGKQTLPHQGKETVRDRPIHVRQGQRKSRIERECGAKTGPDRVREGRFGQRTFRGGAGRGR